MPPPPLNTFVPSVETFTPRMMWPLGITYRKHYRHPKGDTNSFCGWLPDGIRLWHSVADSHERRRVSQEVTIKIKIADNGFVRGNRN
jgi:hypothetical protein